MLKDKKNWANLITFSRIFGVGVIFYITPFTTNVMALVTVIIYTIVGFTDLLDGYIARKYNAVSDLGKVMDPLADKILVLVLLPLLFMHAIDAFPVFLILAREFAIMGIRVFSAKQGLIIAANNWGKIKTAVTLPICGLLMARIEVTELAVPVILKPLEWLRLWVHHWPSWVFESLIWLMVSVTLVSLLDYCSKFLWQHYIKKANGDKEEAKKMTYVFIPNTITLINVLCGVLACITAIKSQFEWSVFYIMVGAILDAFDGKVARRLGVYSSFGAKLDTKADFITFGVAPAIFITMFTFQSGIPFSLWIGGVVGIFYYSTVHYRLNRFQKSGHDDYFDGLPSPVGAAMVSIAGISVFADSIYFIIGLSCILSLLMISKVKYPHNCLTRYIIIFNGLSKLSIVFWFITLILLIGIPFPKEWHIIDITFILTSSYLITPLLVRFSKMPE